MDVVAKLNTSHFVDCAFWTRLLADCVAGELRDLGELAGGVLESKSSQFICESIEVTRMDRVGDGDWLDEDACDNWRWSGSGVDVVHGESFLCWMDYFAVLCVVDGLGVVYGPPRFEHDRVLGNAYPNTRVDNRIFIRAV